LRRSADALLDVRIIPDAVLTLGTDLNWQESETTGDDQAMAPLLERWSRAGYAQLIGDLTSRLSYTLGGRIGDNERFGTFSSVRGAFGVALTPSTSLRLSGGTAFKEPQFPEITGGCCALPNPELNPERSRSWELGVEHRFAGNAFAVAGTVFDQRFRDLIIYAPVGGSEAQYRNARSAQARGWELEARAELPRGASLRASLSGVDATLRASAGQPETPLPRRPALAGSLVIAAPVGARFTLVGDASHIGRRHDVRFFATTPSQEERLPSYTVVGIGATARIGPLGAATGIDITARVDNLLDHEYEAVAGFATPGRVASIGARFRLEGRR
jgi:vitamin B12 transporter